MHHAADPQHPAPPSLPAGEPPAGTELARGRQMQGALKALLDQVRGSREVLSHLKALEAALGAEGVSAIDRIPPPFASKVSAQLGVLPIAADDPLLQELVARVQRVVRRSGTPATRLPSALDSATTVVVSEASHSDFIHALGNAAPGAR
jgi:hypothetical protein